MVASSYFVRSGRSTYRATEHTGGAWNEREQHIAPAFGLLAHLMETDFTARRGEEMFLSRLSFDVFGTMPIAEVEYAVRVVRPGRTIELLEAALFCQGRQVVSGRGWFMQERDTGGVAGTPLPGIPPPDEHEVWVPSAEWPGGALKDLQCRRLLHEPGRGTCWLSTPVLLVDDAPVSNLARTTGLLDFANGMATRARPEQVLFPNLDLTAHFFRRPGPGPVGFDTSVSFGTTGVGLTHTILHDATGAMGSLAQALTVRPVGSGPAVVAVEEPL